MKLMRTKFKIGDRVKAVVGGVDTAPKTVTGTICRKNGGYIYVEQDGIPESVFEFYECEITKDYIMPMSDCEMCWNTPCTCGHEWKKKSNGQLIEMIDMLNEILKEKMPLDENINKQAAGAGMPSLPVDVEIELYNEVCDWYSKHRHMFQTSKYYGLEIEHELFWLVRHCIAITK